MKRKCQIGGCKESLAIVYLTICEQGHISEFYLCRGHAILVHTQKQSCNQLHPVVDYMAATPKGKDLDDFRFYRGQWVVTKDDKVITHGPQADALVEYAKNNNIPGANIWFVKDEDVGVF